MYETIVGTCMNDNFLYECGLLVHLSHLLRLVSHYAVTGTNKQALRWSFFLPLGTTWETPAL